MKDYITKNIVIDWMISGCIAGALIISGKIYIDMLCSIAVYLHSIPK